MFYILSQVKSRVALAREPSVWLSTHWLCVQYCLLSTTSSTHPLFLEEPKVEAILINRRPQQGMNKLCRLCKIGKLGLHPHTQSHLFCKSNELLLHLTLGAGGDSVGRSVVVEQQEERDPCNAPLEECMNANPSHLCNISTRGSTSSVYEYRHCYRSDCMQTIVP